MDPPNSTNHSNNPLFSAPQSPSSSSASPTTLTRCENQKHWDWNTFGQYLRNHRPPLTLAHCSGVHVLEFLRYHNQFEKTKVHAHPCPFFGHPSPPAPCPFRQAWGSLDALIGCLHAAFEENGGKPESNLFLPPQNPRFVVQSTGSQLREEEAKVADSAVAVATTTTSSVASSELRISTFSRSSYLLANPDTQRGH
ncbi:hypothetical protein RJ639_014982 [Escallonia herrerae]|uniref:ALOG domain-containing protein n=1 Tax=Escallonia herrerae TaxID=1293975 RepID=A0AA88VKR8_9ASTE|nr:hypothetical protein RJ639_014982 [Escallonia herrerae]